mgnify:FL=1
MSSYELLPMRDCIEQLKSEYLPTSEKNSLESIIKGELNKIFKTIECFRFIYTDNTDGEFFGIRVHPCRTRGYTMKDMVFGKREVTPFKNYMIELDSKLIHSTANISSIELACLIVAEIDEYMNVSTFTKVIDIFNNNLCYNDDTFDEEACEKCHDLFCFIIYESMRYCSSICCNVGTYTPCSEIVYNGTIYDYHYDNPSLGDALWDSPEVDGTEVLIKDKMISIIEKIKTINPPTNWEDGENSNCGERKAAVLIEWYLRVYRNILTDRYPMNVLEKVAGTSGSFLFNSTITRIRENFENKNWTEFVMVGESSKPSMRQKMKINGLKAIEEDLFEYKMRIRNVETEDDALLLMRQINNRMSVLDNYLMEHDDLSEKERLRWQGVLDKYSKLREELSDKKVYNKRMYGLFVDYNALQQMYNANDPILNTYY